MGSVVGYVAKLFAGDQENRADRAKRLARGFDTEGWFVRTASVAIDYFGKNPKNVFVAIGSGIELLGMKGWNLANWTKVADRIRDTKEVLGFSEVRKVAALFTDIGWNSKCAANVAEVAKMCFTNATTLVRWGVAPSLGLSPDILTNRLSYAAGGAGVVSGAINAWKDLSMLWNVVGFNSMALYTAMTLTRTVAYLAASVLTLAPLASYPKATPRTITGLLFVGHTLTVTSEIVKRAFVEVHNPDMRTS